ncbi:platelet basic protein-like [Clupea harengus]|uniref:Platelet basic protein-like n=1 Tax=Clupea harengus TaxID=7950 RepID=A0A6P8GPI3_CLUHA|nr:platelet basic protein-like [Clupea harengus]
MNLTFTFTLLLVAMAALETKSGPIFFRCQCTRILPDGVMSGRHVNPASVRAVARYPAGAHCRKEEVIIDFIRRKLCVNPKAPWVIALERKIHLQRNHQHHQCNQCHHQPVVEEVLKFST